MISLDLFIPWILCALLLFYPVIEGVREYYYYGVNRAAGFSQRSKDSDRKTINVITWGLSHALPVVYISAGSWLLLGLIFTALAFWRWLVLDGVLNVKRGLGFWYAGSSGRSFTDKILNPLPVPARAALKLAPLVALLLLILFIKYWSN